VFIGSDPIVLIDVYNCRLATAVLSHQLALYPFSEDSVKLLLAQSQNRLHQRKVQLAFFVNIENQEQNAVADLYVRLFFAVLLNLLNYSPT